MKFLPICLFVVPWGLLLSAGRWASVASGSPAESDGQVAAREIALELAAAFTNDGYKIRDGHWSRSVQARTRRRSSRSTCTRGTNIIFRSARPTRRRRSTYRCTTRAGNQVGEEQFFQERSRAAAGVSPVASGLHYVSIAIARRRPDGFLSACIRTSRARATGM